MTKQFLNHLPRPISRAVHILVCLAGLTAVQAVDAVAVDATGKVTITDLSIKNNTAIGQATTAESGNWTLHSSAFPRSRLGVALGILPTTTNKFFLANQLVAMTGATNTDYLNTIVRRDYNGTDWTSSSWSIQRKVDVTDMYYLRWGTWSFEIGNGNSPATKWDGQGNITHSAKILVGGPNYNAASTDLLQVNGGIFAKKVTVTATGWADNVFSTDYRLPTLTEVEAHIKDRQHLPGIPSEAEIVITGVDTGDMLKRHMAKIEELTLYAIAQEKRATAALAESASLKTQVEKLAERLEALERATLKP